MSLERLPESAISLSERASESLAIINNEGLSIEDKALITAMSVVALATSLYVTSRGEEGTVNRWWEKRALEAMCAGVVIASAIANYETWK